MPKVTVFIPVYNTEKYIAQAIRSVCAQTYTDWELVIVDDCSTDNTYAVITEAAKKDARIKIFCNEKNLGMMGNWIASLHLCRGQYWAKLDADDYWDEKMIARCVNILDAAPDVGLVCGKYQNIDGDGKTLPLPDALPDFAKNNSFSCVDLVKSGPEKMFRYNVLRQGIGLMRRSIFDELGNFLPIDNGDTEMWFRVGCHYKIFCVDEALHYHRIWPESFMRKNADENEMRRNKNFFDTRNAIFSYYFEKGKLSGAEFRKFKNDTRFIFNSYRIYRCRAEKKYFEMIKHLVDNFTIDTGRTLKENLHADRLFKRGAS